MFWLNGEFRDGNMAIDIADRGFLLGDGAFETLLVHRGAPAFLDEHRARLKGALAALQIDVALPEDLRAIIKTLAEENGLADRLASARLTVSRGPSGRGLAFPSRQKARATTLLTLAPAPGAAPEAPAILILSRYVRTEKSVSARHKTLNYLDNILSHNAAARAGADGGVMLNSMGRVACASSANIFIIGEDAVATPPIEEGALPGIVRGLLLQSAADTQTPVTERAIAVEELRESALFLTNSLMGLRAARFQDGPNPSTAQTEIFKTLAAWYQRRLTRNLEKNASS